jgi:hypothetical protein
VNFSPALQHSGSSGSNDLTASSAKTSCNVAKPPTLARFGSRRLFPVPRGEAAANCARFDIITAIQKAVTNMLHAIRAEDFFNAMNKLETGDNHCTESNGSYF